MNPKHQWQLPDNTKKVQDQLSIDLMKSQKALKFLKRSVEESREFNRRAQKYLDDSKSYINKKAD